MSLEDNDPIQPAMGPRAHLVSCIPLLMLSAMAAWILLARPSTETRPPSDHVALHVSAQ